MGVCQLTMCVIFPHTDVKKEFPGEGESISKLRSHPACYTTNHLPTPRTYFLIFPTDYGPVKPFNLILSLSGGGAIGATTGGGGGGGGFHFGGNSPAYSQRIITLP
jgi:hypothetical protein